MLKLLVTGGTGFIGKHILEQLRGKYEIHAPASAELDLLDHEAVRKHISKAGYDVVLHTATWNATRNSNKDVAKVLNYNLRMFLNLVRCSDSFGKMLYYGSGAEYDRCHWSPKMKEEYFDDHVPGDDYGLSKYIMRKYAERADNIYDLCIFGVFGSYEDWEIRFISNACCKAVWDLPITIRQNVYFDYLYIDDLVKITNWFISGKPTEKVYNVATGRTNDLISLAGKVLAAAGKKLDILVAKEGLGAEYSGDNTRLLRELGDFQFSSIDDSIKELYEWYSVRKKGIDKNKLVIDK